MSKTSKIMLIMGMGLICIGIILSLVTSTPIIDSILNNTTEIYEQKEKEFNTEDIKDIIVDTDNENVLIVPTTSNIVKVTYYESKNQKYYFEEGNNTIKIRQDYKIKFFNLTFDFNFNRNLKIEIPEDLIIAYDIKTDNGKIEIMDLGTNYLTFNTSNGSITLTNITTEDNISLNTNNSSINLENISANEIYMKTSNGRLNMDDIEAFKITGKTSNGSIDIDNLLCENSIKMDTSNGRIKFDNLICSNIDMKSSNGKISGNITGDEQDYKMDIKTSNSKITINGENYGTTVKSLIDNSNNLKLKTSNGSININFIK